MCPMKQLLGENVRVVLNGEASVMMLSIIGGRSFCGRIKVSFGPDLTPSGSRGIANIHYFGAFNRLRAIEKRERLKSDGTRVPEICRGVSSPPPPPESIGTNPEWNIIRHVNWCCSVAENE